MSHESLPLRRVIALLMAIVFSWLAPKQSSFATTPGRTAGAASVSSKGAFTYHIPIWTPPGVGGVQPHLSLDYSSQGSDGPLGIGWSLGGLSSVSLCNKTVAQDGTAAAITLTNTDVMCLDGVRLRLTSGVYGADGSTYETEVADYSNVTAHGSAENGPASFTVQRHDGLIYTYGYLVYASGTTSYVTQWLLSEVSDRSGNTMIISYQPSDPYLQGVSVPSTISWLPTAHGSNSYTYKVEFNYATISVPHTAGYLAGTAVQNYYLLQSIVVSRSATTLKKYKLTYTGSQSTLRQTLTSVTECADAAATNCLAPTSVSYQSPQSGIATNASSSVSWSDGCAGAILTTYDLNGDGRSDIAFQGWDQNAQSCDEWYVAFANSTGTGYGETIDTGLTGLVLFGNVDGSSTDGLMAHSSSDGSWWFYRWNGTAFVGSSTGTPYSYCTLMADVDGDGRPDLITVGGLDPTGIYLRLNTSANGTLSFSNPIPAGETAAGATCTNVPANPTDTYRLMVPPHERKLDAFGDGQADLIEVDNALSPGGYTTTTWIDHFNGGLFVRSVLDTRVQRQLFFVDVADYNDDGCADILYSDSLVLSACNGAPAVTLSFNGDEALTGLDWDGDGRKDVLVRHGASPAGVGGTLGIYLSTGTGLGSLITTTTSIPDESGGPNKPILWVYAPIHNATGDGLDALLVGTQTETSQGYWDAASLLPYLHNSPGMPPDLAASITDGFGVAAAPTYTPIVNSNYTAANTAQYPEQDWIGPLYVVGQLAQSDGLGGTYTTSYSYSGAKQNLQGRGFEGFSSTTIADSRTNSTVRKTSFETAFPLTGMVSEDDIYQSDGATPISIQIYNNSLRFSSGNNYNQILGPEIAQSTLQEYEVGGVKNGKLIATATTNYTSDPYGNVTKVSTTVTDDDSTAPVSPYLGQQWTSSLVVDVTPDTSSNWCLNQPTQATITNATPAGVPITRTVSFTPDYVNCREAQQVTEPESSNYAVTEVYGFDVFGNVSSDIVTGTNMASRTTTTNWGTTGQFPVSVTNPLSQSVQFGYDPNTALLDSITDANGIQITSQYDAFGRLSTIVRPDGIMETWGYADCANSSACLIGPHALIVSHRIYNTDGSVQTDDATHLDPFDRPLVTTSLLSAGYTRTDRRYDSLGHVLQISAPCMWAALTAPCQSWTTNIYDASGRVIESQRPISDSNNSPATTTISYEGDTVVSTDPGGEQSTQVVTPVGELGQSQDANGYYQKFTYDAFGSLLGVADSLSNTLFNATYDYGLQPYQRSTTDMDRGNWSYSYDALGELTQWTDAAGNTSSAAYDALSRMTDRYEPDLYSHWTWGTSGAAHEIGQLHSACFGGSGSPRQCATGPNHTYAESETYDALGRLAQRTIQAPYTSSYTFTYNYNSTTGLLDTLTYPTVSSVNYALQLQYGYQNGILTSITDISDSPNVPLWTMNTMNAAGQITQETLGDGTVVNHSFDAVTGWLNSAEAGTGGSGALQNSSYLYDLVGNVTQRQENTLGLTESFYYDNLYRLDHSVLQNGSSNGTNLSLTYDATGNITSRSDVNGGAIWTYDTARKHAVTNTGAGSGYLYDANGNVTQRNSTTLAWWDGGMLKSFNDSATLQSGAFYYNQDRQRHEQIYQYISPSSGTIIEDTYLIGGALEVVERTNSGQNTSPTTWRHLVYANGQPVAVILRGNTGGEKIDYILRDNEGSVAALTNGGALVERESFGSFGRPRNATTWSGDITSADSLTSAAILREGYTFQSTFGFYEDGIGSVDLIHMNGRVLDAITGRFLSADPFVPSPTNTQDYNRYSYVDNNPLAHTDPSGFDDDVVGTITVTVTSTIGGDYYSPAWIFGSDGNIIGMMNGGFPPLSYSLFSFGTAPPPLAYTGPGFNVLVGSNYFNVDGNKTTLVTPPPMINEDGPSFGGGQVVITDSRGSYIYVPPGQTFNVKTVPNPLTPPPPPGGYPYSGPPSTPPPPPPPQVHLPQGLSPRAGAAVTSLQIMLGALNWLDEKTTLCHSCIGGTAPLPIGGPVGTLASEAEMGLAVARAIAPSSRALGRALEASGIARAAGSDAHHIVAGTAKGAAAARATLQRFGIGINDAANGVFLQGAQHASVHTAEYYNAVNQALAGATTRTQAEQILQSIARGLQNGTFPP